ncbi:MFS transporter [Paenibacillus sp. P26]|nr:MFS transporter [Paenibacillus sp. P26]
MKTAVWLYLFMFVAFFDLHAQYPILSPFAISLGAAPSFIGLILGVYSITHLPGNLIAGFGVDRYGSKNFIVFSLIVAGIVLLVQSRVTSPWRLLFVRSISGFVLAFLSPACLSLLAKIAKDRVQQGKLMAGNGMVHTMASVLSPAAGAYLVAKFGFAQSFIFLGWGLIASGILAWFGVKEQQYRQAAPS